MSRSQAVTRAPHRTLATVPAVASLRRVTLVLADARRLELACASAFRSISSSTGSQWKHLKIFLKTFDHQDLGTKTCSFSGMPLGDLRSWLAALSDSVGQVLLQKGRPMTFKSPSLLGARPRQISL